jgi:hypothetical protein
MDSPSPIALDSRLNSRIWALEIMMRIFLFIGGLRTARAVVFEFQTRVSPPALDSLLSTTTMSSLEPASVSPLPEGITDPNYKPLPGRLGNLTPGQQHALDTLKRQLVDEGHFVPERMDDATLLRCVVGPCTHIDPFVPGCDRCRWWRTRITVQSTDAHPPLDSCAPAGSTSPRQKRCCCPQSSGGKTWTSKTSSSRSRVRLVVCIRPDALFFFFPSNFEFTEKKAVDKYYPQYYHKMDKVRRQTQRLSRMLTHVPSSSSLTGRSTRLHPTSRQDRRQRTQRHHDPRPPTPALRPRIRKIPHRAATRLLQRRRPPRRNVVHHHGSRRREHHLLLPRQGLRLSSGRNRSGSVPRMYGQVLHHQRPLGVFDRVVDRQALVGRGDGGQDRYREQRVGQGKVVVADSGGKSTCRVWWDVSMRRWLLVERCGSMESPDGAEWGVIDAR